MGLVDSIAELIMGYPQTSTEIQEDIVAIGNWLSKIARRTSWIDRFERQDVLEFGDQKAVAALDNEQREIELVERLLLARRSKLHKELTQAQAAQQNKHSASKLDRYAAERVALI